MIEKTPFSSPDQSPDDNEVDRQIEHIMDTRGSSYDEARQYLGIYTEDELAARALAKRNHPSNGHRRSYSRPPVGEDSVWTPVEDLTAAEVTENKGLVGHMRQTLAELRPEDDMTPLERAQKRAREEKRKRNS